MQNSVTQDLCGPCIEAQRRPASVRAGSRRWPRRQHPTSPGERVFCRNPESPRSPASLPSLTARPRTLTAHRPPSRHSNPSRREPRRIAPVEGGRSARPCPARSWPLRPRPPPPRRRPHRPTAEDGAHSAEVLAVGAAAVGGARRRPTLALKSAGVYASEPSIFRVLNPKYWNFPTNSVKKITT